MQVLITGAAGMLGRKLAERLMLDRQLADRPLERVTLTDHVAPDTWSDTTVAVESIISDIASPEHVRRLIESRPDVIFHLAAVVSGEAESDFDKGYRINLDATRHLLDAIRQQNETSNPHSEPYRPRLIFASSIAVFGAPYPDRIDDHFLQAPLTSYGTQKAISELLLGDYTRRDFLDGVGLRLPTICIRPGRPNLAASGFFSNILREPIHGQPATLPVPDTVRHWFASPRSAIEFFLHAASLDTDRLGNRRCLNLPGLSVTVAEELEALKRIVGSDAHALVKVEHDPEIAAIVQNWPSDFDASRAASLGFRADASIDDILQNYLEDDAEHYPGASPGSINGPST